MSATFRVGRKPVIVSFVLGDITAQSTEAIVNAANSSLMGGGGVDGAIHRKGGPRILKECESIRKSKLPNGLPPGQAVITSGGNLKALKVIHTVGPIWGGGKSGEEKTLASAYKMSLELAASEGLKSVSFPSISTGAYGYPIEHASIVALRAVREHSAENDLPEEIIFVLFSESDLATYLRAAKSIPL